MILVDSTKSRFAYLHPISSEAVTLTDGFWEPRREINRRQTIPSQFQHIETTGRLNNFRRASGKRPDLDFEGIFFNDSDVYKWLEAAVVEVPNAPEIAELVETTIVEIESAQQPDGYLNTYFMFDKAGERWTNLRDKHELYCAGHFLQAAIAHVRTSGDNRLLNVARKLADHIDTMFGPNGRPGACGHEEIEMALVELYRVTRDEKYLALAQRMIDVRGAEPSAIDGNAWFDRRYMQDHVPFRQLNEVTGHAVRMLYLMCGAADVYLETGEEALKEALETQWKNMTERRMYVSGGLGSRYEGEAFGKDYELPNTRAYTETCAAIGSVMLNYRMLLATGECRYADLMETTLYNAVLPGLSLDGKQYFYQNPLANDGTHRRKEWFGCACCPPNVARLLAQLPAYFYSEKKEDPASDTQNRVPDTLYVHLYAAGRVQVRPELALVVETDYPFDGAVKITVKGNEAFGLMLRIPGWAKSATVAVNGEEELSTPTPGTYYEVRRNWQTGDTVTLSLLMDVRLMQCHPFAAENNGRVAVFRGPLLYCLEATDNPHVENLHDLLLDPANAAFSVVDAKNLSDIPALRSKALAVPRSDEPLYFWADSYEAKHHSDGEDFQPAITLVPYYAWANREPGQMLIWLRTV